MDNQNNHSNKGIIIAVLCLVIGVVLGSLLMSGNKTFTDGLKGQAIDSKYAQVSINHGQEGLCPDGQIYSNGGCYNGIVGSGNNKAVGDIKNEIPGGSGSNLPFSYGCTAANGSYTMVFNFETPPEPPTWVDGSGPSGSFHCVLILARYGTGMNNTIFDTVSKKTMSINSYIKAMVNNDQNPGGGQEKPYTCTGGRYVETWDFTFSNGNYPQSFSLGGWNCVAAF